MTAARDDDFMALPGTEVDSTDTHHARERLSDDTARLVERFAKRLLEVRALCPAGRASCAREDQAREGHVVRLTQCRGHVGRAVGRRLHEGLTPPVYAPTLDEDHIAVGSHAIHLPTLDPTTAITHTHHAQETLGNRYASHTVVQQITTNRPHTIRLLELN